MAKKPKKEKAPPDPAVKEAIDLFHDLFFQKFQFKPNPRDFGRFGKDLKENLLPAWGRESVVDTIRFFFSTTDVRVQQSDYSPIAFMREAQRLRVRSKAPVTGDKRTMENIDAAARATGRR